MRYAFSSFSINPHQPVRQFGHLEQVSRIKKVHDDLCGRIVAFDDGKTLFINICCDLLALTYDYTQEIRKIANDCFGRETYVVLSATHTHYGGDITDPVYHDQLISRFRERIKELRFTEGKLRYTYRTVPYEAAGTSRISHHSALVILGLLEFFDDEDNEILDIVSYNCHPTILSARETDYFSAEYPGYVCSRLSEETGAFVAFLQGAAGDVSTRFTRKGQHYEDVANLGDKMVDEIRKLKKNPAEKHEFSFIDFREKMIPIVYDYSPVDLSRIPDDITAREKEAIGAGVVMRQKLKENQDKLGNELLMSKVSFGEVSVIYTPCELFSYYLKYINTENTILSCYSNGYAPYILPLDEVLFTYETFYDVLSRDTKCKMVELLSKYSDSFTAKTVK